MAIKLLILQRNLKTTDILHFNLIPCAILQFIVDCGIFQQGYFRSEFSEREQFAKEIFFMSRFVVDV